MCPRSVNTKVAAQEELRRHIERTLHPERFATSKNGVPTFHEWFTGRFWREWVVGRRNKPTEVKSKQYIYERHLKPAFGDLRLDENRAGEIAEFRATLVEWKLGEKRINNILTVLSKTLKYAVDVELIFEVAEDRLAQGRATGDRAVGLRAVRSDARRGEGRRSRTGMRRCTWRARQGCVAAR